MCDVGEGIAKEVIREWFAIRRPPTPLTKYMYATLRPGETKMGLGWISSEGLNPDDEFLHVLFAIATATLAMGKWKDG